MIKFTHLDRRGYAGPSFQFFHLLIKLDIVESKNKIYRLFSLGWSSTAPLNMRRLIICNQKLKRDWIDLWIWISLSTGSIIPPCGKQIKPIIINAYKSYCAVKFNSDLDYVLHKPKLNIITGWEYRSVFLFSFRALRVSLIKSSLVQNCYG